jgi:hypothetical protein
MHSSLDEHLYEINYTYTTLITKLNHIINGIKWSASLVFLVAYKINSEINLM